MLPTSEILATWKKFDDFPMDTLTKAWYYHQSDGKKQRSVELMREHRSKLGVTGNCFDLAFWLLDEFKKDGVVAYPVGHDIDNDGAHVAVLAVNEKGNRFLCDLGDQWLTPILIDSNSEDFSEEVLSGFFPGAKVQVKTVERGIEVLYHRPNGKISKQTYNLEPIPPDVLLNAAERSQNNIYPKPLLECRLPYKNEIAHWEFYNWESFLSTNHGLYPDSPLSTVDAWVERIHQKTGYDRKFLYDSLKIYRDLGE
ncbi:MAG TPA: hypothetical protein VNM69_12200 [Bacillus sp. (in: firmicutes)]|uniref:hypothetical protein n=1 Tax=Bacillus litorisediminis TaxID=2922713 RepID=UPI001FAD61EA|nr:hypothetical protein [Bacillus litorisediminis]HWO76641.1 hypothetical protein [Bacillus sp. (in: firmicutes)]